MTIADNFRGRRPPRQEPVFEGDRRARNMGDLTRKIEPHHDEVTDYAPPDVRAMANLEKEIGELAAQEVPEMQRTRDIGNSTDMRTAQQVLNNTVTAAHEDCCKAVDKIVDDARALVHRIEKAAEAHKLRLKEEGQKIAAELEAAVQVLHRTVEWVEKQSPDLRNPKLEPAKQEPAGET